MTQTLMLTVSDEDVRTMTLTDAQRATLDDWSGADERRVLSEIGDLVSAALVSAVEADEAECEYVGSEARRAPHYESDDEDYDASDADDDEARREADRVWDIVVDDADLNAKIDEIVANEQIAQRMAQAWAGAYWRRGEPVQLGEEGTDAHDTGVVESVRIDPTTYHEMVLVVWDHGPETELDVDVESCDLRQRVGV